MRPDARCCPTQARAAGLRRAMRDRQAGGDAIPQTAAAVRPRSRLELARSSPLPGTTDRFGVKLFRRPREVPVPGLSAS